jgi:hypothetical protein
MAEVGPVTETWPDSFDLVILAGYVLLVVGLPVAGYVLLAVDIRAYYRRLRQALVVVSQYTARLPSWVAQDAQARRRVPPCVQAFGLSMPFTEEELLEAYRQQVKTKHPDRGGSREDFLQLQRHFEQARSMLYSSGE